MPQSFDIVSFPIGKAPEFIANTLYNYDFKFNASSTLVSSLPANTKLVLTPALAPVALNNCVPSGTFVDCMVSIQFNTLKY